MASELVNSATSDKLSEMDWAKNIEICELVACDHRQAKDVVKAIKKCLGSKNANTQLFSVLLLEMLMNNIGEHVHQQVIEMGILPILVKIVKKKSDHCVGDKIFLLLDAAQTSLGGNSGRFPQYYSAYCELVSAGVQFPQSSSDAPKPHSRLEVNKNNSSDKQSAAPQFERKAPKNVSISSILEKAGTALEVLRDVLNAVDTQHSEGAKDEFTLDLVEQCSFHKQQVMHLAMTSRDDKVVTRAIELNEQLERILHRHDALISRGTTLVSTHIDHEQAGEAEEAEQLLRRIRKGKACLQAEEEESQRDLPLRLKRPSVPGEMLHRPLIRPLTVERPKREPVQPVTMEPMQETAQPPTVEQKQEANVGRPMVALPPPPAKPVERERFFRDNKADGSALNGHMSCLTLHSRNASTSLNASIDYSN